MRTIGTACLACAVVAALAGRASGQSATRAAFVGNNGNLEGSIASYTIGPGGAPTYVTKFVTGATTSGVFNAGTNVASVALSPDGSLLAASHATSSTTLEQLDVFRVNADASLTRLGVFQVPDSPLDAAWVSNELLAVTETRTSLPNRVRIYRFDRATAALTPTDDEPVNGFMASVATIPSRGLVLAPQSTSSTLSVFRVDAAGTLTLLAETPTGQYPLAPAPSPVADRVYVFGGISAGGRAIGAFDLNPTSGALAAVPGSPFLGGSSPKGGSVSPDGSLLAVAHGTDATARLYRIDASTGGLTDTGWSYDVGIQGDLGSVEILDNLVLATDRYNSSNGTGLLSFTFAVGAGGAVTVTQNGPVVASQGPVPDALAVWSPAPPACYANCDGSTSVPALNALDFGCFLSRYVAAQGLPAAQQVADYANCDGSTSVPALNALDFGCFLERYRAGCR